MHIILRNITNKNSQKQRNNDFSKAKVKNTTMTIHLFALLIKYKLNILEE